MSIMMNYYTPQEVVELCIYVESVHGCGSEDCSQCSVNKRLFELCFQARKEVK